MFYHLTQLNSGCVICQKVKLLPLMKKSKQQQRWPNPVNLTNPGVETRSGFGGGTKGLKGSNMQLRPFQVNIASVFKSNIDFSVGAIRKPEDKIT